MEKITTMERTIDTLLNGVKEWVKNKQVISPEQWLTVAADLNVLIGDEHDKLFSMQHNVAQARLMLLSESKSAVEAKYKIEATDIYRQMKMQKAKIDQINEFIKIAKKMSSLKDTEWGNQK